MCTDDYQSVVSLLVDLYEIVIDILDKLKNGVVPLLYLMDSTNWTNLLFENYEKMKKQYDTAFVIIKYIYDCSNYILTLLWLKN